MNRTAITSAIFERALRPALFTCDPEKAHDALRRLARTADYPAVWAAISKLFQHEDARLNCRVAGIELSNPVGLAAGFDKNAEMIGLLGALGFSHLELGTVTAVPQPGNPRPRIFRFAKDEALINRMGFPSGGASEIATRLERTLSGSNGRRPVLGINIGKSKDVSLEDAVGDYLSSFDTLERFADYVAVNVSSPNTKDLRQMQERERLSSLLKALVARNAGRKPIFVKIAPDLTHEQIDDVVACCLEEGVSGIIATNTTLSRDGLTSGSSETGGMSGAPLHEKSVAVVRYLAERLEGKLALIGVGGIRDARSALAMLAAGANAVQIYTSLIFEGPSVVASINRGLSEMLDQHQCQSLTELVAVAREKGV